LIYQDYTQEILSLAFLDLSVSYGRPSVPFTGVWVDRRQLTDEMARSGIGQAAVYCLLSKSYNANYGNDLVSRDVAGVPSLLPTWVLVPTEDEMGCSPAEFADRLEQNGVRAVRLFPSSQSQPAIATRYAFSRWFYGDFLEELERRGVAVILEFTPHRRSEPEWDNLYSLACEFPSLPIVMGDGFQRAAWSLVKLMRLCPNLYAQTSGLDVHRELEYMVQKVGPERFVAASKFPVATFGTMVGQVLFSNLPHEHKKLIAGGNARRLLGLDSAKGGAAHV
jgi:predicted TIM-barrel fold metal-dependent hydrolase